MELEAAVNSCGYEAGKKEADADTIKMFVGQIPRHWNEAECQKLFEEYGPVFHLNILKDKATNASRGCCFVTYFHRKDAISAQNALHNLRVLPQMNHPVQMKPADVENRNERKLFIGMLSKSMDENDVRAFFKEFGQIEECTILRDEGRSRGCAFITYCNRACANAAIRKMNQSQTFEGCSKPIVVKFADSQKDKESKKPASPIDNIGNSNKMNFMNQLLQNPTQTANANLVTNQLLNLHVLLQQPGIIPLLGSVISSLSSSSSSSQPKPLPSCSHSSEFSFPSSSKSCFAPSSSLQNPVAQSQFQQQQQQQQNQLLQQQKIIELLKQTGGGEGLAQLLLSGLLSNPSPTMPTCHYSTLTQPFNHQATDLLQSLASPLQPAELLQKAVPTTVHSPFQGLFNGILPSTSSSTKSSDTSNGQFKGPEGSNLFIYHLPQDYTDTELNALFSHFGRVLSAKVFIDKQTNLSKCFGFVSYENGISAQNAISAMNGFTIGSKRLKVQLKRGKEKPYQRPNHSGTNAIDSSDQQIGTPP